MQGEIKRFRDGNFRFNLVFHVELYTFLRLTRHARRERAQKKNIIF